MGSADRFIAKIIFGEVRRRLNAFGAVDAVSVGLPLKKGRWRRGESTGDGRWNILRADRGAG